MMENVHDLIRKGRNDMMGKSGRDLMELVGMI
jgi:hypothetical protein